MKSAAIAAILLTFLCSVGSAQTPASLAGDYSGALSGMPVTLHLVAAADGTVSGTADSPAAHMMGLPCTDFRINGKSLSFNVPNVQGSWVGFISTDGNSLTGTWSQGMAVPLNFARVGSSQNLPAAQPPVQSSTSVQKNASTCPPTSMANYWDGASWKPLTQAENLMAKRDFSFKEAMKRPLDPNGGNTNIQRYKGSEAPLTLGPQPKFCFNISVNEKPEAIIGSLDIKDGNRQIELKRSDKYNSMAMVPARKSFDLDVTRTSDTSFEATPKQPLPPGQYLINEKSAMNYDFGVKP
jgi:hypothetical protein